MYKIKISLGPDIGWLFIVGADMEPQLYNLEDALEIANSYTNGNTNLYMIIDENGEVYNVPLSPGE